MSTGTVHPEQPVAAENLEMIYEPQNDLQALCSAQPSAHSAGATVSEQTLQQSRIVHPSQSSPEGSSSAQTSHYADQQLDDAMDTSPTTDHPQPPTAPTLAAAQAQLTALSARCTTADSARLTALAALDHAHAQRTATLSEAHALLESQGRAWFAERAGLLQELAAAKEALARSEARAESAEEAQRALRDAVAGVTAERDAQRAQVGALTRELAARPPSRTGPHTTDPFTVPKDPAVLCNGAQPRVADVLESLDDLLRRQRAEDGVSRGLREAMEVLARQGAGRTTSDRAAL